MLEFLKLEQKTFGLDISDQSLKIVKLKKKGKFFHIASFGQTAIRPGIIEKGVIQDEDSLATIIQQACKSVKGQKLNTKYVIASLPEERSFLQVIQMPLMKEDELTSAILFEAENYIPLPVSEVYLDFQTIAAIKNTHNHLDVLIGAVPKKIVNTYVSCLKKAGLVPLALEVESQAIARALVKNQINIAPIALVDFGKTSTAFIVFFGHSIRFTCSIPISSEQVTVAIKAALQVEEAKAEKIKRGYDATATDASPEVKKIAEPVNLILGNLVVQIKKYINFYQDHASDEQLSGGQKIEKVLLCGGGAQLKGLPEFLSSKLRMPVQLADAFTQVLPPLSKEKMPENPLSYATALGLALREVKPTSSSSS